MGTRNEKTDQMPMKRVILMTCGRYNPPTHMHLRMFERARDHLHTLQTYKVIGGIISPISDCANNEDLADSTARCNLVRLAIKNSTWIRLSTWEVCQNISKSVRDILEYHQNRLNSYLCNKQTDNSSIHDSEWVPDDVKNNVEDESSIQIKLLCGSDLLEKFAAPGFWPEDDIAAVVGKHGLVVIGKDTVNPSRCIYESDTLSKYLHNIHVVTEWIPNEVNSTRIRRSLRRGESVKYLVNNSVIKTIYENGIYGVRRISNSDASTAEEGSGRATRMGQPREKCQVVLMSCGSYNPPTHMHLRMFERARDHLHKLGTHVVLGGVISPVNDAYTKKDLASSQHRCEMLRLALRDSDWIKLSTWETRQPVWTRTRQSLQHHQGLLDALADNRGNDANSNNLDPEDLDWIPPSLREPDSATPEPVQIKLLCGGDLLESFATPGLWSEEDIATIVGQYGLIVITREGSNPYKFIYDSDILSRHLHNIQIVTEWIPNEVSSTRIRRALKRGESVKYLLPDDVIDYVYESGIYGANRPSAIKLELSAFSCSSDTLDVEEVEYDQHKQQHDSASLTPSPSDVIMSETNPCVSTSVLPISISPKTTTTTTTLTTMTNPTARMTKDIDISESVAQKNSQNCKGAQRDSSPSADTESSEAEETELAREKFFRSINDSLKLSESSSSLQLASVCAFSQISSSTSIGVAVENVEEGSSAHARDQILAFDDASESETAASYDNAECSKDCKADEHEDDHIDDFVDDNDDALSIAFEDSSDSCPGSSVRRLNDNALRCGGGSDDTSAPADTLDELSDQSKTLDIAHDPIEGKYVKSIVSSRKVTRRADDEDDADGGCEARAGDDEDEDEVESHPVRITPEHEDIETVLERLEEGKFQPEKNVLKFLDEDISYVKRLRLIVNEPSTMTMSHYQQQQRQQLQGSLDSINQQSGEHDVPMSKKSKSFESIKRALPMSFCRGGEIPYCEAAPGPIAVTTTTDNASELESDEFCSACCPQPSSGATSELYHTAPLIRSEASSPDSATECDICSSSQLLPAELCEICGEPADQLDSSPGWGLLPKAKSTLEMSRGMKERYEPEQRHLRDCRLGASLAEPLYVNVPPRRGLQPLYEPGSDGVGSSRSRRPNRKSSYQPRRAQRSAASSTSDGRSYEERRRYSSADNLPNRSQSFKSGGVGAAGCRFTGMRHDNRIMTSADCVRAPRVSRSRSLRRSADNVMSRYVGSYADNLDSLEENAADVEDSNGGGVHASLNKLKIRDSDTIKMILTKHGIKIISQKETVL